MNRTEVPFDQPPPQFGQIPIAQRGAHCQPFCLTTAPTGHQRGRKPQGGLGRRNGWLIALLLFRQDNEIDSDVFVHDNHIAPLPNRATSWLVESSIVKGDPE